MPCCIRTIRCRRCCIAWCCTGSCAGASRGMTLSGIWVGCCICSCAGCAGRTRRSSTAIRRGVQLAPAGVVGGGAVGSSGRGEGGGVIAEFVDAEILEPADVHVAQRLTALAAKTDDERVAPRGCDDGAGAARRFGVCGAGRGRRAGRCAGPAVAGGRRVAGGGARRARCGVARGAARATTACCISTGIGAKSSRSPRICWRC